MTEISTELYTISIVISVGFVFYIFRIVYNGTLHIRDSLLWLFIGVGFIMLAIYPKLLRYLADLMGIGLGISALFLISSIVVFIILFQHSILISKSKESNKKMVQEIALLKIEIEKITDRKSVV